ncbi:NAD-dependent epimerase/dehydratase family protein [Streptomyces longispororuber]|uniref:NAD-dependent epimerase/dehydratase family protein n=1 Tax=Streptomyces longispororuber TaxID=68230 RepID=UPI003702E123
MGPTRTFPAAPAARPPWGRALVTGGAGFLGSHLCERLTGLGVAVDCVDNLSTGRAENIAPLAARPGFRFLEHDLTRPDSVAALPGPYDLVLHCACPAAPADCRRLPLETLDAGSAGTRHALAVARRDRARLLFASASAVYGDPLVSPQREDYRGNVDPVGPDSARAEAHRFAEALVTAHVAAHGTDAGIVRLFGTYGPRMRADDGRPVPALVARALAGAPVTLTGDGRRTHCLCYVDDVVDGVLLVAASRSVRPVNLGGGDVVTEAELARRVIELTGSTSRVMCVGAAADGGPRDHLPDTGLVRELFGWAPVTGWEEGLKRTIGHRTGPALDGGPVPGRYEDIAAGSAAAGPGPGCRPC